MIIDICQHLVPGAELSVHGEPIDADQYASQVQWLDARPQPSWADIEAARPVVISEQARQEAQRKRQADYQIEADPLFFGWQRGENTEQEWLDKVAEIRARHPYS